MGDGIEIQNLTKRYAARLAVNDLTLTIPKGEIFGFVGPNGAGKTTTIRILCGLLKPDLGKVSIGGYSVKENPNEIRRLIGYMPDEFGIYPDLQTWEYLDFFATCYDMQQSQRITQIDNLLELVDLHHRKFDPVDKLSRGMKQRLSLARVLMHDPHYLILDEPASGLDPRARIEMRELLKELAAMGKSIFFSSHILSDIAEICDQVGIIEAGQLISAGRLQDMQRQFQPVRRIRLVLLNDPLQCLQILTEFDGVTNIEVNPVKNMSVDRNQVEFSFSGDDYQLSELLSVLVRHQISVLHFTEEENNLEDLFMQATRGQVT